MLAALDFFLFFTVFPFLLHSLHLNQTKCASDRCIRALFHDVCVFSRHLETRFFLAAPFIYIADLSKNLINQLQCWAIGRWIKALFYEIGEDLMLFLNKKSLYIYQLQC